MKITHNISISTLSLALFLALSLTILPVPFAGPAAQADATTPEQKKAIESLSPDQLYNLYAEQIMLVAEAMSPESPLFAGMPTKTLLKKCLVSRLEQAFTAEEIRVMFIQPPDMDKQYYTEKVNLFEKESAACAERALQ
ncbi:MAG: hypothetical protein LBJ61_11670 [Deltaproteobacteria bacterium]|jgi:hypothetical protein|nr:hypothetical protein [Deltaproteobacteria bacterium]